MNHDAWLFFQKTKQIGNQSLRQWNALRRLVKWLTLNHSIPIKIVWYVYSDFKSITFNIYRKRLLWNHDICRTIYIVVEWFKIKNNFIFSSFFDKYVVNSNQLLKVYFLRIVTNKKSSFSYHLTPCNDLKLRPPPPSHDPDPEAGLRANRNLMKVKGPRNNLNWPTCWLASSLPFMRSLERKPNLILLPRRMVHLLGGWKTSWRGPANARCSALWDYHSGWPLLR